MAEISILSNARIAGALQFDKDFSEFPSNPKFGTLIIKNQCLYGYIRIDNLETWYPFASKTSSYIHAQGGASTTWIVNHGLGSTDVWYQVKDESGNIMHPSEFKVIDGNTVQVIFTEAVTGTVVVVSTSSMDVPSLRTTLLEIGSTVRIDTAGMTIEGERVLTRAVMTIGDGTSTKFTVSDLERLNFVSGTGVNVSFDSGTKSIRFDAPGLPVTPQYVANEIDGVIGGAPATLNTLGELASAIGNDPTYSLTVTSQLNTKLDKTEVTSEAVANKVLRLDANSKLPASITGNAATATNVDWSGVLNKPTTLSGYGITDAMPMSGSPTGTFTIQNLVVSGSILPSSTGTLDIGSPTQRFGTIYVDEAKLSTNTLYIGDTPILGTSMDTVLIKADPNQSINMSTRGTGSTLVTSEKNVSIQTTGLNADVNIQANGSGSKVRFGASQTIDFTAPEVVTYGNQTVSGNHSVGGNLTITGNLTVSGSQTTINATTVTTKDNIILVNSGEVGSGVTSGKAGIQVDRGDEADYQIIFDEIDDLFKVGMVGQLETIASRPWVNANYSLNTHTHADATASVSGLMSAANFTKLAGIEANANNYSHPTGDGNLHVPATGTTNSKKLLMAGSAAGSLSWSFVDWADIQNKPSTYAPSAHKHGDADLTAISWTKVTGKPTTLSGYGITDAQSLIATGTTAQYYRGDKTWATLDKAAVGLSNVENTALSTWAGSSNLTTAGALTAASLTVTGNLTVNGTTTTVNSTVVAIDDPVMTLGGDTAPTTDDGKDRGIEFRWHNGTAAKVGFFGFDDSTGKLTFIPDATNTSEVFTGTKGTIDAYLAWSDVTGKPTTVSGYGITDAMTTAQAANSITGFGTSGTATTVARGDHNHNGVYQPLDGDLTAIAGLTGTSGLLKKTALNTWTLDTNTYLTGNQSITVSGDASGSGTTTISLTLANVVTAGTATKVTYDDKGRVTAGASLAASDIPNLDWSKITSGKPTTLSGYGITDAPSVATTNLQNGDLLSWNATTSKWVNIAQSSLSGTLDGGTF